MKFAQIVVFVGVVTTSVMSPITGYSDSRSLELLHVSYDTTRELFRAINRIFVAKYQQDTGITLSIKQSHGGSASQARAVIDGLGADVVTLALWPDVDAIRKAGLIAPGWETRLPNRSGPWTSTIVFVVRKGNPKSIRDWPDLVRPGIEVVVPSPKTSGNGKLAFLAAWGSVTQRGGTEKEAREFVSKLYRQVPVLDSGARASTVTFAQREIGDVHLTWENEAHLEVAEAKGQLELLHPPISILAEPTVAVVDANVERRRTGKAAKAYLEFLYSTEAQEIVARHFYRPVNAEVQQRFAAAFPAIRLFTVGDIARDWVEVHEKFFADGALFDQIYQGGAR
ncbi:Sulfate-binding protein [bacterium HR30]|nr:Sulfate-binding protein [bacterium HR30]